MGFFRAWPVVRIASQVVEVGVGSEAASQRVVDAAFKSERREMLVNLCQFARVPNVRYRCWVVSTTTAERNYKEMREKEMKMNGRRSLL
jgi:hypothetical protein